MNKTMVPVESRRSRHHTRFVSEGLAPAGFTLVELLVVIGVVSLLIAILLPALNKARAQASELACASNLRQCGMILFEYANENRGQLPYRSKCNEPSLGSWAPCTQFYYAWGPAPKPVDIAHFDLPSGVTDFGSPHSGSLSGYSKDLKVFGCPAIGAPPITDAATQFVGVTYSQYSSLYINYMMFWGGSYTTTGFSTPDFRMFNVGGRHYEGASLYPSSMPHTIGIDKATITPLMQDATWGNFVTPTYYSQTDPTVGNKSTDLVNFVMANHLSSGAAGGASSESYTSFKSTPASNPSDSIGFRKGSGSDRFMDLVGGANILYWDGHVEWVRSGEMQGAGWPDDGGNGKRFVMSTKGPFVP